MEKFENMSLDCFNNPCIYRSAATDPIYLVSIFRWLLNHLPLRSLLPCIEDDVRHLPAVRFDLSRVFPLGIEILPSVLREKIGAKL